MLYPCDGDYNNNISKLQLYKIVRGRLRTRQSRTDCIVFDSLKVSGALVLLTFWEMFE